MMEKVIKKEIRIGEKLYWNVINGLLVIILIYFSVKIDFSGVNINAEKCKN